MLGNICSILPASRVRYFSSQEGATIIFPRKDVFAWLKKERAKTRPWSTAHSGRRERKFPRKNRLKQWIHKNAYNFCYCRTYAVLCSQDESVLRTDILKNNSRSLSALALRLDVSVYYTNMKPIDCFTSTLARKWRLRNRSLSKYVLFHFHSRRSVCHSDRRRPNGNFIFLPLIYKFVSIHWSTTYLHYV